MQRKQPNILTAFRGRSRGRIFTKLCGSVVGLVIGGLPTMGWSQAVGNPVQRLPKTVLPAQAPPQVHIEAPVTTNPVLAQKLTPRTIDLQGVHAVPFAEVAALVKGLTGHEVQVADLVTAANSITALYKAKGYPLSMAVVPPQSFDNGVVRINVVEGHVTKVVIQGDAGPQHDRLMRIAEPLLHDTPLRQATFERVSLLLGQVAGITADANIPAPTTLDGSTTLTLTVKHKRVSVASGLSSNQPGVQGLITLSEMGNTPLGETLSVSALVPPGRDQQHFWGFSYAEPLGYNGMTIKVDGSYYHAAPDTTLGLPDYVQRITEQEKVSVNLSFPFILRTHDSLTGTAGVYAVSNEDRYTNQITNLGLGLRSQVRVLQAQLDDAHATDTSQRVSSISVAKGLSVLGAGAHGVTNIPGATLNNPVDVSFWRVKGSITQANQWPWWHLGTVVSVIGQYSGQRLPSSEQITFGGQRFALGYQPGETAGDKGYGVAFELNRPFTLPWTLLKTITPYTSYALAKVYLNSGLPIPDTLESVAVGTRMSDGKHYNVDLSVAKPVGDKPTESSSRSIRVNVAFSYQIP